ncbi:MAG TPA: NAD(P)H-dependent glycerol-3-phosphate dehydrogenase [Frankiaceae bacterium]|nr:NAD(P)H-dependent glycerol-3-phosphate dehydrogenase [Frankiaceae bacterium]
MTGAPRSHFAVMGAGSWGTAFAKVLCDAGTPVRLWARRPELAAAINETSHNPEYLADVVLPAAVRATGDAAEALDGASVVVLALPAQTLRENLRRWVPLVPDGALYVSLAKGVELASLQRMSEVVRDVAGVPEAQVAVVTGPNLAGEIARGHPSATVVASTDLRAAERLQRACASPYLRPYTNTDVVGCELGGAVKNVIAMACGMAAGMGFGDNTKATIMTRGLAETARLGVAYGADPMTFAGLAGMGDLVATCSSPLSRNRTVGEKLGRGMSLAEVIAEQNQIAEGVKSCEAILGLAQARDVEMPIVEHVVLAVHEGMPIPQVVRSLMSREPRSE